MPHVAARGRGRRTMNEINMVPFIDVMLVLLIIFMVTAPLITPSMIDLPSMARAKRQPDKVVSVVINKDEGLDGRWGNKPFPLPLEQIAGQLAQIQAGQPQDSIAVVISADKSVR